MLKQKAACDSSVLINFAKIGRLGSLLAVFEKPLLIPREVYSEAVERGIEKRELDALLIEKAVKNGFILVKKAGKIFEHPFLGAGEKAVISLALENNLKAVCFDEAPARNAARQKGLKTIGSLGVLALLLKNKLVTKQDALGLLGEMIKRDYRISAKILEEFKKAIDGKEFASTTTG